MSLVFSIRPFQEEDRDGVKNLVLTLKKYYPEIDEWLLGSDEERGKLESIMENEGIECEVAKLGDDIVAVSISERKSKTVAKISTFLVKQGYQHGYAIGPRLLLEEIQKWARRGIEYLYVTFALEEFDELESFFERYGFQFVGIAPQRYRSESCEIVMGKTLVSKEISEDDFREFIKEYLFRLRSYDISEGEYLRVEPKESKLGLRGIDWRSSYGVKISTSREREEIEKEMDRLESKESQDACFVSFYGVPPDLRENSDCRVLDAYDIETMFYPVHLRKMKQPPVIIPIKRGFADQLIPKRRQTTFSPEEISSRTRNAYYKYPSGHRVINPGTDIVWYVSGEGFRGEAKVKDYMLAAPEKIWDEYRDLGIYSIDDIKECSEGGNALAIEFDWYEEYEEIVSIEDIEGLEAPQTLSSIDEETLRRIRETGFGNPY